MRIPNPYFKNVPCLGDLVMDYIIYEYDYPVLFICKNGDSRFYLCDCCDTYKEQRWLIAPITLERIEQLLGDKITIREAFENATGQCCVATWSIGELHEKYKIINSKEFLQEDLPEEGAYVEADEGEHQEYIECIKFRINYRIQRMIERKMSFCGGNVNNNEDFYNLTYQYENEPIIGKPLNSCVMKGTTDGKLTIDKPIKMVGKSEKMMCVKKDWYSTFAA